MAANNQGIAHLATKSAGLPACKNYRAHVSVSLDRFVTEPHQCVRCAKHAAIWLRMRDRKATA